MSRLTELFRHGPPGLKLRLIVLYVLLALFNAAAWIWALAVFYDKPALLGTAALIYGLGLRHAVDADHIAAIDNVTRKLMQDKQRPVAVGLFFALGHSTVVIVVASLVAAASTVLENIKGFQEWSGLLSAYVSASFLLAIALMNVAIFIDIVKVYRHVRAGGAYVAGDLDVLLNARGFLSRLLRPVFRLVSRSWHMFPVGLLFGLGFDTATEVSVFGVAAAQAVKGLSIATILVFPFLFAAGMSLIDTTDGVLMLGAYEWAFVKPMRKLFYNMTITLVSIFVALVIGGIELLGVLSEQFDLKEGTFWGSVSVLNQDEVFNSLGFAIIGVFVFAWIVSYFIYRAKRIDDLDGSSASA